MDFGFNRSASRAKRWASIVSTVALRTAVDVVIQEAMGDQAFHQRLHIREVRLAAPRARDSIALGRDAACPARRGAPSRARRRGRQCCSRASHTGRQYCAVDSMTTFLDVLLAQPVGQAAQIGRRRANLLALKVEVAVDQSVIARANSQFRTRTPRAGNCAGSRV